MIAFSRKLETAPLNRFPAAAGQCYLKMALPGGTLFKESALLV